MQSVRIERAYKVKSPILHGLRTDIGGYQPLGHAVRAGQHCADPDIGCGLLAGIRILTVMILAELFVVTPSINRDRHDRLPVLSGIDAGHHRIDHAPTVPMVEGKARATAATMAPVTESPSVREKIHSR